MSGGISPRHAQSPLSGERRETLSITHHALSPPPSHHHLYIIHPINWLQRFYRITMSLKRPFVPKSDVKQRFTTTTTLLTIDSLHLERLARWTVIVYSKGLGCSRVNDVRCLLFTHGTRMLDHIPPTHSALYQHARRALLQAAFIWRQVEESQQHVPEI